MSERATRFHANPWLGVFYVTGGGSPFLAEMLSTPGASNTVLDVRVPYSSAALTELLGRAPEQAASGTTALQLAVTAYEQAQTLTLRSTDTRPLFGFGCTAALGTNRVKKGTHRAHWAIHTATDTYLFETSYAGDRASEEAQLREQLWHTLALVFEDDAHPLGKDPDIELIHVHAPRTWHELFGPKPYRACTESNDGRLLLPGSFNPIHDGHRQMLEHAESLTQRAGALEITVHNADKASIDYVSLERRLAQIGSTPVWLTNTPKFADKAKLFPDVTFVLGVDTMERIAQLRFYNDSHAEFDQALHTFHDQNTHFLVFGREIDGRFKTLDDLELPDILTARASGVAEAHFRNDVSSTALRQLD